MTAIAYKDHVSSASPSVFSSSGPLIGSPANIATEQLAVPFGIIREAGPAGSVSVNVDASWGESRAVRVVALLDIRVQRPAGSLDSYFLQVRPLGGSLGTPDPLLTVSGGASEPYPTGDFIVNAFAVLPVDYSLTGVRLFMGTTSAGDFPETRITVGRVWAGPAYIPPAGIQTDWETAVVDPGRVIKTRAGQGWPDRRQRARRLSMAFVHVPFSEAFGVLGGSGVDLQTLGYAIGNTEPCIVLPRTVNADGSPNLQAMYRIGMYGHAVSPLAIRHRGGDYYDASVQFEELF